MGIQVAARANRRACLRGEFRFLCRCADGDCSNWLLTNETACRFLAALRHPEREASARSQGSGLVAQHMGVIALPAILTAQATAHVGVGLVHDSAAPAASVGAEQRRLDTGQTTRAIGIRPTAIDARESRDAECRAVNFQTAGSADFAMHFDLEIFHARLLDFDFPLCD